MYKRPLISSDKLFSLHSEVQKAPSCLAPGKCGKESGQQEWEAEKGSGIKTKERGDLEKKRKKKKQKESQERGKDM